MLASQRTWAPDLGRTLVALMLANGSRASCKQSSVYSTHGLCGLWQRPGHLAMGAATCSIRKCAS